MEAIRLNDFEYIPTCDRGLKKEDQTIFTLGILTYEQEMWLENNSEKYSTGDIISHILTMGLKGVKNFKIEGKEIKAERVKEADSPVPGGMREWKNRFLSRIPREVRSELAFEIRMGKGLGTDELKNS